MEEIKLGKTESTDIAETKPYTLRKLQSCDVFTFSTILKKIGFNELKGCFASVNAQALANETEDENAIEQIGLSVMLDIAGIVVSHLADCQESIYKLLSDLSGMKKEEIATLDMNVFIDMIFDVFKKEEFKDFFKVVSKLFK